MDRPHPEGEHLSEMMSLHIRQHPALDQGYGLTSIVRASLGWLVRVGVRARSTEQDER
jgi:hypothetical protein